MNLEYRVKYKTSHGEERALFGRYSLKEADAMKQHLVVQGMTDIRVVPVELPKDVWI